jgi:hypothetical protein
MPDLLWQPGAFAGRHPDEARRLGDAHALEAAALGVLFDNAGVAGLYEISREASPEVTYPRNDPGADGVLTCCDSPCGRESDTSCNRGTCCCDVDDDAFEAVYPDAMTAVDNGHALQAALRDILADPAVEDVGGAIAQAQQLAKRGALAEYYAPASPAKKLPDGSDAPARCPICLAMVCPDCGCACSCCDSSVESTVEAAGNVAAE